MTPEERKTRVKAARAAYARAWRKKNPDRVKQYNENYWLRKFEKMEEHPNEADADSEKVQR